MKKIGLILANPITNFGAHLQAYATQYALDKLGVETEIIDYERISGKGHYFVDFGFFIFCCKTIISKLFPPKTIEITDKVHENNIKERAILAKEFRKNKMHNFVKPQNYKELVECSKKYFAVLIGSDQMWLPGVSFGSINSLRFVPQGVLRISYATSLGVSEYPSYCKHSANKMWTQMNHISVREEQGAKIIKEICNNNVEAATVCDPTYLLSKEEWQTMIEPRQMCERKYVFCYFLGEDEKSKMCAYNFAKRHDLYLVSVRSCESFSKNMFADEVLGAIGPEDFVNWIRGAEFVFTDSFHGLAFSVINQKQFYVFYRVRKDSKQSRNSRIDNILKLWRLKDRIIENTDIDWTTFETSDIDYSLVNKVVSIERKKSIAYLKKALGINENSESI